jgi:hypothetical protein
VCPRMMSPRASFFGAGIHGRHLIQVPTLLPGLDRHRLLVMLGVIVDPAATAVGWCPAWPGGTLPGSKTRDAGRPEPIPDP